MMLYINSDRKIDSGWEGYDFLVNGDVVSAKQTTLQSYKNGGWEKVANLKYRYAGNELMVEIPKNLIGTGGFDFHWSDNIPQTGSITDFFAGGDNAPERRSNYRFQE